MLVALTGPDGTGKSTVSKVIKEEVLKTGRKLETVDRWDILNTSNFSQSRFIHSPLKELKECVSEMKGPSRFLFILWTIYSVLEDYDPASPTITFIDSYWMKHAASEIAYGLPESFVENAIELLPKADLTICLDLSPEIAYQRKSTATKIDLNAYECGMNSSLSSESFIHHQNKIRNQLQVWSHKHHWRVVEACQSPSNVADSVSTLIYEYLHSKQS
ncbi:hypothetical protein [uncultured Shewanella sp.]|uniref:hypothetical protein n=1 Tax=uncultured Shewanella sp. TaxID=173975 RepID=UPI00260C6D28|nr:hypothetical protein [uncultured Shewanella sp.]